MIHISRDIHCGILYESIPPRSLHSSISHDNELQTSHVQIICMSFSDRE